MVRAFLNNSHDSVDQDLSVSEVFPNCVSVGYTPSQELLNNSSLSEEDKKIAANRKHELILSNGQDDFVSIYPLNTLSTHSDFLNQKHEVIESITLEGFGFKTPETSEDVLHLLEGLPSGFVKDYEYGLGLLKDYRFIIHTIEQIQGVRHLVISRKRKTEIEGEMFILRFEEFDALRKGVNRISSDNQSLSRSEKDIFTYNSVLHSLNPSKYPEKKKPYKKDTVYKILSSTAIDDSLLSKKDSGELIKTISSNKEVIFKSRKKEVLQLHDDIELLSLKWLIEEADRLLSKNSSENEWQKYFNDNPFALYLVFGYPVIKVQDQASVGGRKLSGSGDKITDFLVKNNLTDNCALVEIKKPNTSLLRTSEYRGGVYAPSNELSGSIAQLLDQKHKFQKGLSSIKDNSGVYDIESYSVDCVLIIGRMPDEKEKKKSFELSRYNSKEVRVFTFDEVYGKLESIYLALKAGENE